MFREFERILDGEHVIEEANGLMSREQILLLRGPLALPGLVLGFINEGAQSVAAVAQAGNAGNGVFAAPPTADAATEAGVWQVRVEAAAANAGGLGVYNPDGDRVGNADVGVAYDGPINFTLNDGAVDFAPGDTFDITVSYAARNLWAPLTLAGNDGREVARGVLFARRPELLTADTRRAVAHVRDCDLNGKKLTWPAGITEQQRKAQEANLALTGVLVRY